MELNSVPTDIIEDVLEENICKALSLTGVNVISNDSCIRLPSNEKIGQIYIQIQISLAQILYCV